MNRWCGRNKYITNCTERDTGANMICCPTADQTDVMLASCLCPACLPLLPPLSALLCCLRADAWPPH